MVKKSFSKSLDGQIELFDLKHVVTAYELFEEKLGIKEPYEFSIKFQDGASEPVTKSNFILKTGLASQKGNPVEGLTLNFLKSTNAGTQALSLEVAWWGKITRVHFHIYAKDVPDSKIYWAKSAHADIERLLKSWIEPKKETFSPPKGDRQPIANGAKERVDWKWATGTLLTVLLLVVAWLTYEATKH